MSEAGKKPNILVICSDQHHPLFSGYRGHAFVKTPTLDRLAGEGTHFSRAYCNSPVCTPSRMSFITGKYVHQIDNWHIGVPLDPHEMTWPRRLERAGIPSTMLGKMDFCGPYQDGGFTDYKILKKRGAWSVYPRKTPFAARLRGYTRPDKRRHLLNAGIRETPADGHHSPDDRYGFYDHDRTVTDWAVEYLQQKGQARGKTPWALYVGLLFPHWPYCVPKKYFEMYHPGKLELPNDASFPNEKLHPALRHFQQALDLGEVTDDMLRRTIAAYQGMISCMDDMIGEILEELATQGLADNTYIIYTTDHGESLGEHGLFYKQCSYEGSVGVPLIMKGPGIPAAKKINEPVTLVDLYPTVLDIAGLNTEPDRPGNSLLPLARGQELDRPGRDRPGHERQQFAFSEYHGNFFRHDWYMLVMGDYKYTYYAKERPSLFNLRLDPRENSDLGQDPQYAAMLEDFESLLRTVTDPDAVSLRAKQQLGLIGPNGEDYTETLSVSELVDGRKRGDFLPEPGHTRQE